ncbi:PepSY-associated TM helix domain-containing protein [Sphaerotilus sp.]|uniref:PepSY-associated TM helix domain-containing protein n=1 Tax=Sphaerotilus sp. TaxID=2093942 RepID=UPI002ACD6EB4|nr:PepSY-associated TM helix domain-containing protein [Sphaerotilus sp.]MDZ7855846.1 PepSY-associated TM helix domain-containing protein [Sphaerotilus sp.]
MFQNFRLSMAWLHTWFGLVLGYVLMACFFFGSLSVFDREIDRWAIPETRFDPQPMPSFDKLLLPIFAKLQPNEKGYEDALKLLMDPAVLAQGPMPPRASLKAEEYWAYTTHRDPVLRMGADFGVPNPKDPDGHNHIGGDITIDPRSGATLPSDKLKIGSDFFYPMHYSLHLHWKDLGYWIVGLAALVMLAALVSGVVMHRKIFREFFTFRPKKSTQRSTLDLHNLTGVVALPFHFFFAFTGLVIFSGIYLPVSETMLRPLAQAHEVQESARTGLPHKAAGVAAPMASVDAMVAEAKRRWAARDMPGEVGFLTVNHVGDSNGYVSIYRAGSDSVALVGYGVHFKAATGELLREDPPRTAVGSINEFLTGLHLQHFEHWLLRWFYVLGGLIGCVCIATGFIFFVEKRKKQHAKAGLQGSRVVDALAVATVTGMLVATLAILVANRLLPADLPARGDWEEACFWGAWLVALAHALWRTAPVRAARIAPAWREQCWAVAALAVLAVLLNWASTGHHLLHTLGQGNWPVAGMDLSLLATAALATLAARHLRRRESGQGQPQRAEEAEHDEATTSGALPLAGAAVATKAAHG